MSPTKRYAWLGATAVAAAVSIGGSANVEAQSAPGAFSVSPVAHSEQEPPPGPPVAPQPPRPAPRPERPMPPEPPPPPPRTASNTNIRVEITITDQSAGQAAVTKNVALTVSDGHKGMIRSETTPEPGLGAPYGIPLHIDAQPTAVDGKIRLRLAVSYKVAGAAWEGNKPPELARRQNNIQEELTVTLENGKPMIVSQSADPLTDRKVTVEVKATILK